jgi:hypothetical protein
VSRHLASAPWSSGASGCSRSIRGAYGSQAVRALFVALSIAPGLLTSGCGKQLTATSTCSDLLAMSPQDQDAAIRKIAAQYHAGNALTPLGRPNIEYLCGKHPKMTLGTAIRDTG